MPSQEDVGHCISSLPSRPRGVGRGGRGDGGSGDGGGAPAAPAAGNAGPNDCLLIFILHHRQHTYTSSISRRRPGAKVIYCARTSESERGFFAAPEAIA